MFVKDPQLFLAPLQGRRLHPAPQGDAPLFLPEPGTRELPCCPTFHTEGSKSATAYIFQKAMFN